jgi:endo-1,4-beta-xylanase
MRGQVVGWDVVNEAVAEDGNGWRDSLWSRRLGDFEHIALAYRTAREADPHATLLLNDYNLEYNDAKRATFLKLAERLLASGAPLTGLGTQMHVAADIAPGQITAMIRDLARLGLPIHVSELDVSLSRSQNKLLSSGRATAPTGGGLRRGRRSLHGAAAAPALRLHSVGFARPGLVAETAENAADAPAPCSTTPDGPRRARRRWCEALRA